MNERINIFGNVTAFFLRNKPISILLLISIFLLGIFGYLLTPKQYNPEITLPAFEITIPYPGATPIEVRDFIIRELEEKILEIPGVDTISSASLDGGVAVVRVTFLIGEDFQASKVKLFTKVSENLNKQIGNIGDPLIQTISPDDVPIIVFALTSPYLSQNEVREKALLLSHSLQTVKGVANIDVTGGERKALRIVLDPKKLKVRKISAGEVERAITHNINRTPLGQLESSGGTYEIEVDPQILSAEDAKKIIVFPGIYLGDIAEVSDGYLQDDRQISFQKKGMKEEKAVFLHIAKRKKENASHVAKALYKEFFSEIKEPEYASVSYSIVRDDAKKAQEAISGLGGNLIQSIIIVGFVLFLFLGGRAAFLVALSIPITLLLVFFAGYIAGQTINRITLFALILSLGLLVDSATVIVENIYRHIKKSKGDGMSIPFAVSEVSIGLLLSTITSVIVFLPVSKVGGMMGSYMGPIAFFVPMALIFSLFVAYIITPFLSSIFLKYTPEKDSQSKRTLFNRLTDTYSKLIKNLLNSDRKQRILLFSVFSLLFLVFLFPIFKIVHFQMLPKSDQNKIFITIDLPESKSVSQTKEAAKKAGETILSHPEVKSIQTYAGAPPVIDFNGLFRGFGDRGADYQATIKANLSRAGEERSEATEDVALQIRKMLHATFPPNSDIDIRVVEDPPGPPVQATLIAKIKGEDLLIQKELAHLVEDRFHLTSGVVDINTSMEEQAPKVTYKIDYEKAKNANISEIELIDALKLSGAERKISEFHPKNTHELAFVQLSFPQEDRQNPQSLSEIFLKNKDGEMLPVSEFVYKTEGFRNETLFIDEQENVIYVTAEMEKRSVVYAAIDLISNLLQKTKGSGFTVENWNLFHINFRHESGKKVSLQWGGEWKMTLENFRDLGLAMMAAFFLIYIVLVLQFRSFLLPPLIMATIFLAFIGILPGFALLQMINGTMLTATALIGFIALMGIVVNNAIIYLEYLEVLKKRGMEIKMALAEAGKIRLRPILLTSLTTVLGSLTIVADPVWSGLAWTIVFGLSFSTLLTLIVFPVLYYRTIKK